MCPGGATHGHTGRDRWTRVTGTSHTVTEKTNRSQNLDESMRAVASGFSATGLKQLVCTIYC